MPHGIERLEDVVDIVKVALCLVGGFFSEKSPTVIGRGWGSRIAQTHGIMATTSNPNDYDPPDMSSKRRELELVEQRGDVLHFPDPIPP